METQSPGSVPPSVAREQLRDARQKHDASVRRAMLPAGFILASSVVCGAQTVAPAYKGPGSVVSIIAVVWFLAELLRMAARNQWRPLRSWPKPKWGLTEVALISVAVLVGGVVGPHLLASHGNTALVSWGLGGAVTAIVAACLFAAKASYRRRASRAWQR
jgi:hypothetical protein